MLSLHCRTTWKMRSRRHTYCKKTTTTTKSDNIERQQFCQCVFRLLYICLLCVCVPPSLCFIDFLFILLLSFRFSCASFVASVLSRHTLLSSCLCCCGFQCSISPWMFNLHFTLSTRTSHTVKGCTICITYSCWSTSNNFNIYWEVKHHVCKYVMH